MKNVLIDASVWIDYFHDRDTILVNLADDLLADQRAFTGDYILHEGLPGFDGDGKRERVCNLFETLECHDMLGDERAVRSATRYRQLRKLGVTIRKPNDAIIASFCIDEGFGLLSGDKDFVPYGAHLGLDLVKAN